MMRVFFSKFSLVLYFLIATLVVLNINKDVTASTTKQDNLNFVLIGKDGKEDNSIDRGDAIMLVNVKFSENKVNIISIPRDSLVSIPCGPQGSIIHKIAHAYSYGEANWKGSGGGGVCVASTVETLFGIPPTFYVLASFDSVKDVIDQIGGIEVIPKFSFCVGDVCFTKGQKTHLNGAKALMYARHRKSLPYGDIDRTYQHRQIMVALFNKYRSLSRIEQIKITLYTLTKISTNASVGKITDLAKLNYDKFTINTLVLNGSDYYIDGGYYYKVDKQHLGRMIKLIK